MRARVSESTDAAGSSSRSDDRSEKRTTRTLLLRTRLPQKRVARILLCPHSKEEARATPLAAAGHTPQARARRTPKVEAWHADPSSYCVHSKEEARRLLQHTRRTLR